MVTAAERFSRGPEGLITARIIQRQRDEFERQANAQMEALRAENAAQRAQIDEFQQAPPTEQPPVDQEPVSILGARVQEQSTGPPRYEIVGYQKATKREGTYYENIFGRTFATEEEAKEFVEREGKTKDVRFFGKKFGYDNAEIRQTTEPSQKTFTRGPLSTSEEAEKRQARTNLYAKQAAEKVSAGQQISAVERAAYSRVTGGEKLPDNSTLAPYGYKKEGFAVREKNILAPPTSGKEVYATRTNIATGKSEVVGDTQADYSDRKSVV